MHRTSGWSSGSEQARLFVVVVVVVVVAAISWNFLTLSFSGSLCLCLPGRLPVCLIIIRTDFRHAVPTLLVPRVLLPAI